MPPESKVTALPTRASSGPSPSIRITISFGGWSVPAETASRPPMPRSTIWSRSITSTLTASCSHGDLERALGEVGGGGDVGGQVLELAGAVGRLGGDAGDLGALGQLRVADQRQGLDPRRRRLFALLLGVGVGLEAVEAVGGHHGALDQRGRQLLVAALGHRDRERGGPQPRRLLGGDRGGHPDALGVELVALAHPHHEHPLRALGMDQGRLAVGGARVLGAARPEQLLRQLLVLEQQHGREVGVDLRPAASVIPRPARASQHTPGGDSHPAIVSAPRSTPPARARRDERRRCRRR